MVPECSRYSSIRRLFDVGASRVPLPSGYVDRTPAVNDAGRPKMGALFRGRGSQALLPNCRTPSFLNLWVCMLTSLQCEGLSWF